MTTTVLLSRKRHQQAIKRLERKEITSPLLPVPDQKDAHFKSACLLAHRINTDLESGRVHYRTKAGLLLTSLDEVVRALLDHELAGA